MRIEKFITRHRIIDLLSTDLKGALTELLDGSVERFSDLNRDTLLKGLLQRENTMTTYLGLGVALPHVRVKMSRRYILAIGRSRLGLRHDGAKDEERVHLIVMLIAGEIAAEQRATVAHSATYGSNRPHISQAPAGATENQGSITHFFRPIRGVFSFVH